MHERFVVIRYPKPGAIIVSRYTEDIIYRKHRHCYFICMVFSVLCRNP